MIARALLVSLLFSALAPASAILDCPPSLRTIEAVLTNTSQSVDSDTWYTAVDAAIHPRDSTVSRLFRFIPAVSWSGHLCTEATTAVSLISNMSSLDVKSTVDILNLLPEPNLPDWSLWADRSVLVLNIRLMELDVDNFLCPRLKMCSILGLPSDELLSQLSENVLAFCLPDVNEFSGDCKDTLRSGSSYTVLFPVSSAFVVHVDDLGSNPMLFDSKLNFVVSAGYRLPPGVFQCPPGLFACPLPSGDPWPEFPKSSLSWDQRVCLPRALHCDGVPNCPGSAFDEENCENSSITSNFPTIQHELDDVHGHLGLYDAEVLHMVGLEQLAIAGASAHTASIILYSFLSGILIVFFILITVGWLMYKRSHSNKPYSSIIEANGQMGGHIKDTALHDDLLEEAIQAQNGSCVSAHKTREAESSESAFGHTLSDGRSSDKILHVERV